MYTEGRPFFAKVRENASSLMLGCYVSTLLLWYAHNGVLFSFSLGIFAMALLPVVAVVGRFKQFVRELTPFLVLLLSYEALQGVAGSLSVVPVIHATGSVGRTVHYGFLEAVQSALLSPDLTDAMTILYGLHFPLIIASAVLLWYSNKILYKRYMYSLVACSYASLLFYVLAPSAPPWYSGVVTNLLTNTGAQGGASNIFSGLISIGNLMESDRLAAFPSLHAAYVALFGYFTIKLKKIYGLVSIPIVAGILFSTIYLGQHYIIDLVAGVAVAACSVLIVTRAERQFSPTTNQEIASPAKRRLEARPAVL